MDKAFFNIVGCCFSSNGAIYTHYLCVPSLPCVPFLFTNCAWCQFAVVDAVSFLLTVAFLNHPYTCTCTYDTRDAPRIFNHLESSNSLPFDAVCTMSPKVEGKTNGDYCSIHVRTVSAGISNLSCFILQLHITSITRLVLFYNCSRN